MNITNVITDLKLLPCLSGLKDDDLGLIEKMARVRRFKKNEVIFEETEKANFFFIITSGSVKLYKASSSGKELLIKIMKQGDYFCCAPLYCGIYPVSAMAIEESNIIMIPSAEFKELISGGLSTMGLKIISSLCSRIRYLSDIIENITFKDVEERIVLSLFKLAEEKEDIGDIVNLKITHQELAAMTGTVREVVSRCMSRLKREGVILESTAQGLKVKKSRLLSMLK